MTDEVSMTMPVTMPVSMMRMPMAVAMPVVCVRVPARTGNARLSFQLLHTPGMQGSGVDPRGLETCVW